jgi:hypothetical protein
LPSETRFVKGAFCKQVQICKIVLYRHHIDAVNYFKQQCISKIPY